MPKLFRVTVAFISIASALVLFFVTPSFTAVALVLLLVGLAAGVGEVVISLADRRDAEARAAADLTLRR